MPIEDLHVSILDSDQDFIGRRPPLQAETPHNQDLLRTMIDNLTAYAMPGARDICLAAGMDDYISKPVDQVELQNVLEKVTAKNVAETLCST